jgi:shikimate dehydrogenase
MRLYGLIGYPLSHSFSAAYFAKKFADENIRDTGYQLFPIPNITELPDLLAQQPGLAGFNVTIPYKIAILPYLSQLSAEAAGVGAVNCVRIERTGSDVKLTGHNTDIFGFRESLLPFLKPNHKQALVLGTGGAAKAVCYTLQQLGIAFSLVSRKADDANILSYRQLNREVISGNLLIINTTPAGMYPNTVACPEIPYRFLTHDHVLYDLVYNPVETLFMKKGLAAGATVSNGLLMLELQAEKSWEIWNG